MKMHANDVGVSVSLVQKLVASQFPEYGEQPIQPVLPSGTDNALFKIGERLVARLPRLADKEKHITKEYLWLSKLAPLLPLAVPKPIAIGKPSKDYPFVWSIYEWLNGSPVSAGLTTDTIQVVNALSAFILALQKIDTKGAPEPKGDFDRGQPLARRDQYTRTAIAALKDSYDMHELRTEWQRALNADRWIEKPVWIHGDLDGRNMLFEDGQLSAVIDFGSLGIGDPAYDVMVAWKVFTHDKRQLFKAKLNIDNATWVRSRGLALSQAVMILSYYTVETNPVLVSEAQNWLKELGF